MARAHDVPDGTRDEPRERSGGAPGAGTAGEGIVETMTALMGRYCDGDAAAFHDIYSLLAPRLLAYATGLCGDRATAEDLLQQTFMKLHQARATYVRGANPIPWLYTIAHRTCLDELRRRKRARVRLGRDATLPTEPTAGITGAASGEQAAPDTPDLSRELDALARLPLGQRQALLLTKIHGRSTAEAAAILGTTVGAVKLRVHRGYVTLRRLLAAASPDPKSPRRS
jgi:RNA polymerase sigma-70 factor (ECF subfamily)